MRCFDSTHRDTELVAVVKGNTRFAVDLYRMLKTTKDNLFYSPFSISVAMAMTLAGARGETETQMEQTLHLDLGRERVHAALASLQAAIASVEQEGNVELSVANRLWPQQRYPFLEEYLELLRECYGVTIEALDFGDAERARKTINAWVEEKTGGKITDLIGPGVLDELTRLVLTNGIYFKGNWASRFEQEDTSEDTFWISPVDKTSVPMMTQVDRFGYSAREPGLQILELPYTGNQLSLIVLLPKRIDGISELETALTEENLSRWTSDLSQREVSVHLPRFRIRSQFGLNGVLIALGMEKAFGEADFSGMDGTKALFISAVAHQAFVDVNEEGTEAAAATAVVMAVRSVPEPLPVFRADHPFLFVIRENSTGSILFLGRVSNPGSNPS
jgi:serpin B